MITHDTLMPLEAKLLDIKSNFFGYFTDKQLEEAAKLGAAHERGSRDKWLDDVKEIYELRISFMEARIKELEDVEKAFKNLEAKIGQATLATNRCEVKLDSILARIRT